MFRIIAKSVYVHVVVLITMMNIVCVFKAILYKKYTPASDVWSFGVLMYEIWSLGNKPFDGKTNQQVCLEQTNVYFYY